MNDAKEDCLSPKNWFIFIYFKKVVTDYLMDGVISKNISILNIFLYDISRIYRCMQ